MAQRSSSFCHVSDCSAIMPSSSEDRCRSLRRPLPLPPPPHGKSRSLMASSSTSRQVSISDGSSSGLAFLVLVAILVLVLVFVLRLRCLDPGHVLGVKLKAPMELGGLDGGAVAKEPRDQYGCMAQRHTTNHAPFPDHRACPQDSTGYDSQLQKHGNRGGRERPKPRRNGPACVVAHGLSPALPERTHIGPGTTVLQAASPPRT